MALGWKSLEVLLSGMFLLRSSYRILIGTSVIHKYRHSVPSLIKWHTIWSQVNVI